MRSITVETISEGHGKVVWIVRNEGEFLMTEDGKRTIEHPDCISVLIRNPMKGPMRHPAYSLSQNYLDAYARQFTTLTPRTGTKSDPVYTYFNRYADYPIYDSVSDAFIGDGDGWGVDQIRQACDKIAAEPASRRIVMHTWQPMIDPYHGEPPCMQMIQWVVRDGKLNTIAYFRSNDMLNAWGANAYGITMLTQFIINILAEDYEYEVKLGTVEIISCCAHIYEASLQDASKFLQMSYHG